MSWRLQPSEKQVVQQELDNERLLVERSIDGDAAGVKELLVNDNVRVNADAYNMSLYYNAKNYWTPLHHAAAKGRLEVVEVLIEHGANLDARDMVDMTPVHLAAENGHLLCLHRLLEAGASCNIGTAAKRPQWVTSTAVYRYARNTLPLHLAALNNRVDCILELMINGADYNAVDGDGKTALYISAEGGHEAAILTQLHNAYGKTILSLPSHSTEDTALHHCISHCLVEAVKELLLHGSDVNHCNRCGLSPLHLSLFNTSVRAPAVISALVNYGYNLNIDLKDGNGITALEYVCFRASNAKRDRRPYLAAFLIAHGADHRSIKSVRGHSLLQQELSLRVTDSIILRAIVDSTLTLPSLSSLGLPTPRADHAWEMNLLRAENMDQVPPPVMASPPVIPVVNIPDFSLEEERYLERRGGDGGLDRANVPLGHRIAFRGRDRNYPGVGYYEQGGLEMPPQSPKLNDGWRGPRDEVTQDQTWREYVERCAWYSELASAPRSLQQHCRVAIRQRLGAARLRHVRKLPLPVSLQRYLLLDVEDPGMKVAPQGSAKCDT